MSVDTCQKYSLCPEKAVCGVTAVRLPLTQNPPRLGRADRRASCVPPEGEKRTRGRQQGGSSALLHQDKCFPSRCLTSLHRHCPQKECGRALCVSVCVRVCACVCVCVCVAGVEVDHHSKTQHRNHLTNVSAPLHDCESDNWILNETASGHHYSTRPKVCGQERTAGFKGTVHPKNFNSDAVDSPSCWWQVRRNFTVRSVLLKYWSSWRLDFEEWPWRLRICKRNATCYFQRWRQFPPDSMSTKTCHFSGGCKAISGMFVMTRTGIFFSMFAFLLTSCIEFIVMLYYIEVFFLFFFFF